MPYSIIAFVYIYTYFQTNCPAVNTTTRPWWRWRRICSVRTREDCAKQKRTERKNTEHVFIINYDLSRDVSTSLVVRRHWRTFPRRLFPAADRFKIINNNIIMRILIAVYAVRFKLRTSLYLGENKWKRSQSS